MIFRKRRRWRNMFTRLSLFLLIAAATLNAQTVAHGKRYPRLVIRNAMVIEGNGTPASGPKDIVIDNNRILAVIPVDAVSTGNMPGMGSRRLAAAGDVEVDATGKYVMPGLINAHAHLQDERGGI